MKKKGPPKIRVNHHIVENQTVGHVNLDDLRDALLEILKDPVMSRMIHLYSDVDRKDNSQHHTLGTNIHQSMPGL